MRRLISVLCLPLALGTTVPAFAQDAEIDPQSLQFSMRDDTYITGAQIDIEKPVRGDVLFAGGQLTVSASIGGDLTAAGGRIVVDGSVRDDARIAGGDVTINGNIGGDLLVFGGRVTIGEKSTIAGDVLVAGGSVTVEGRVRGNLRARGSDVNLLGPVDGSVDSRSERINVGASIGRDASLSALQWYVGDRARIGGKLRYWQPQGERDFTGVHRGKAVYDTSLAVSGSDHMKGDVLMAVIATFTLFSLLSGALLIALLLFATKTFFRDAAKRLRTSPGRSLLYGFLYFVATPFILFLLFITLAGIPIAFFLATGYVFSLIFAKPLTAIVLAKWIEQSLKAPLHGILLFLLSVGILIVLKLLFFIPVFGWITLLLAVCGSYGAIIMMKWERFLKVR